jgi:hypothetical protein
VGEDLRIHRFEFQFVVFQFIVVRERIVLGLGWVGCLQEGAGLFRVA